MGLSRWEIIQSNEANIRPFDIVFLYPGQKAIVKLTAFDYTIYGGLEGEVENIFAADC